MTFNSLKLKLTYFKKEEEEEEKKKRKEKKTNLIYKNEKIYKILRLNN